MEAEWGDNKADDERTRRRSAKGKEEKKTESSPQWSEKRHRTPLDIAGSMLLISHAAAAAAENNNNNNRAGSLQTADQTTGGRGEGTPPHTHILSLSTPDSSTAAHISQSVRVARSEQRLSMLRRGKHKHPNGLHNAFFP